MSGVSTAVEISRVRGAQKNQIDDDVAVEEPLELQLCSQTATDSAAKSISITMRTPGDDIDLALGFLAGEAIITHADAVLAADHCGAADPETGYQNTIRIELKPGIALDLERLKRHFYTTSSCGVSMPLIKLEFVITVALRRTLSATAHCQARQGQYPLFPLFRPLYPRKQP